MVACCVNVKDLRKGKAQVVTIVFVKGSDQDQDSCFFLAIKTRSGCLFSVVFVVFFFVADR